MKTCLVQPNRLARGLCGWLAILMLAAACAGAPAAQTRTAAPASTTTAGASATPPTPRATATSVTATPPPARPSPTETQAPAEPTLDVTAVIAAVLTAQPEQVAETHASPNGQWRVEIARHGCAPVGPDGSEAGFEQLRLIHAASGETRVIEDQLLYCGGLGAFGLGGLFWSGDSRYFYYTNAREAQPDGGCLGWYRPATRLEAATGERVQLVQGPESPDGFWQAGIDGPALVLWNRQTGAVLQIPRATAQLKGGGVAWAPDGKALVYLQWTEDCVPIGGQTSVVRLDLDSRQQTMVLAAQPVAFARVRWDAPYRLRLFTLDNQEWRYHLVTKVLSQFS